LEDVVMADFSWRDKRVFLTGHTGFKGSWLAFWLQSLGAEVTGYALAPSTNPNLFDSAQIATSMRSVIADICDVDRLKSVFAEARPEIVFHMAAQPLVRYSYVNPVETYSTNVMGTVHLLEAVRHARGVKAVVNVTSDKCYENREWVWAYRESELLGGYDPYSNSKACAELVTAAFRSSYFNPVAYSKHGVAIASARAGNVVGGGDWAEARLLPDIMRAVLAAQPVVIRSPDAIRPWQHVLEPLSGYMRLAERLWENGPNYAESWNFGPNEEDAKPVAWITDWVVRAWGEGSTWEVEGADHPHEATYLKLDCSKAKARLNWNPKWNIEQALTTTVEWYKRYQAGHDIRSLMLRQIQDYMSLDNGAWNR
jgi:CDP-glucose 4,6-dehydratase